MVWLLFFDRSHIQLFWKVVFRNGWLFLSLCVGRGLIVCSTVWLIVFGFYRIIDLPGTAFHRFNDVFALLICLFAYPLNHSRHLLFAYRSILSVEPKHCLWSSFLLFVRLLAYCSPCCVCSRTRLPADLPICLLFIRHRSHSLARLFTYWLTHLFRNLPIRLCESPCARAQLVSHFRNFQTKSNNQSKREHQSRCFWSKVHPWTAQGQLIVSFQMFSF